MSTSTVTRSATNGTESPFTFKKLKDWDFQVIYDDGSVKSEIKVRVIPRDVYERAVAKRLTAAKPRALRHRRRWTVRSPEGSTDVATFESPTLG